MNIGIGKEESYNQKYKLLDAKFSGIKNFVDCLEFNIQSNPYYVQVASEYFFNLAYLTIDECIIPCGVLKNIFNSSKSLEYVSLNDNLILFGRNAKPIEEINLPQSLKSLELGDNSAIATEYWEDPLLFFQNWSEIDSETTRISLKLSSNLPKLNYLHLMDGSEQIQNNLEYFLISNTQLKSVKLYLNDLTFKIFKKLTNCSELKTVDIQPLLRGNPPTIYQNHQQLPSVKKLTLDRVFHKGEEMLTYITSPFINVTELKIANFGEWSHSLYLTVQKFKKLEKLVIYNTEFHLKLDEFFLASKTLKKLEFVGLNILDFRFSLLRHCPKINTVSIDISNFTPNGLIILETNLRKSTEWTLIKFTGSIKYYK